MKTIFITGASSGLGKAAAKLFAARGWKVIATMRNPQKETELSQVKNITLLPLDVTNPAQISETTFKAIGMGDIDVVFNNAGIGLVGPLESTSDSQLVRLLTTNLLGVIRVVHAFIPHFRERQKGMFITTTSIGGQIALPFNAVYHATKWGLEGWSESMAFELKKIGVTIKTILPGGIRSDFFNSFETSSHPAYQQSVERFFSAVNNDFTFSTPESIAEVVFEAATDGRDQLRYVAGEDAREFYKQRKQMGDEAFRKQIEEELL